MKYTITASCNNCKTKTVYELEIEKPKREWVGLTDEEIETYRYMIDWTAHWSYINFARAIEAALRSKNT